MNWAQSPLSNPRSRRWWEAMHPAVLLLWVSIVLACLWAGIVAIAWVVWNVLG